MPTIALPLYPPKSKLEEMPVVDVDLALDPELTKMITAGEIATQHIALACEFLTPQDLEREIDPLTFGFFEDCRDERAAIDSSQHSQCSPSRAVPGSGEGGEGREK